MRRLGLWRLEVGAPRAWRGLLHLPGCLDGGRDFFKGKEADLAFPALPTPLVSFSELAARSPRTLCDLLESGDLFLSY